MHKKPYSYKTRPTTEAPTQAVSFKVTPTLGAHDVSGITFTTTEELSLSEKEAFEREKEQNALLATLIRNGQIRLSFQEEELEEAVFQTDGL